MFRVEETDNVVASQDVVQIFLVLQRNLPRCRRIDGIDFLAAGMAGVVGRHVKDLALSVDRIEDDFFAQDDRVSSRSQFVERQNVEPRSFVAGRIKQVYIKVEEIREGNHLDDAAVLDQTAHQLFVFSFILFISIFAVCSVTSA